MSKKRVLIIGAGCAGMSYANQLAQHTKKFDVTLIDSIDRCVEQAFSIPVDKEKYDFEHHGVHVRLSTELTEVIKQDKQDVQVKLKSRKAHYIPVETATSKTKYAIFTIYKRQSSIFSGTDEHTLETVEEFEELVLCVLPDQAKILLGKTARWIDKFVLC
ncbi:unnamed protein product [Rotaria sordida]|uniref:FAD/NAD(P)-binding domain-containing protein n=1 Tax=Rotaria sordida TaxID=392033 RepID=A0A814VJB8_9BILA|nr:unnamed protein product [Rotaria sordida]CAF3900070.1 unnamed protein product [Rotaria sordida]CAF3900089.1 unnamed protein product [Rotaria sordida]